MQLDVVDHNTPFTRNCPPTLSIPVKHTTGRYYSPEPVQVVLKYAPGHNPNGSQDDIAGVVNNAGNVFGLMPHPEHAVDAAHRLHRRTHDLRVDPDCCRRARAGSLTSRTEDEQHRRTAQSIVSSASRITSTT